MIFATANRDGALKKAGSVEPAFSSFKVAVLQNCFRSARPHSNDLALNFIIHRFKMGHAAVVRFVRGHGPFELVDAFHPRTGVVDLRTGSDDRL